MSPIPTAVEISHLYFLFTCLVRHFVSPIIAIQFASPFAGLRKRCAMKANEFECEPGMNWFMLSWGGKAQRRTESRFNCTYPAFVLFFLCDNRRRAHIHTRTKTEIFLIIFPLL